MKLSEKVINRSISTTNLFLELTQFKITTTASQNKNGFNSVNYTDIKVEVGVVVA